MKLEMGGSRVICSYRFGVIQFPSVGLECCWHGMGMVGRGWRGWNQTGVCAFVVGATLRTELVPRIHIVVVRAKCAKIGRKGVYVVHVI